MNNIIMAGAPAGNSGSSISTLVLIVAMIVIFYFFLIRPQQKKQKELQKQIKAVKKGDKILTNGGIYAKVLSVKENIISAELSKSVKVEIEKGMVAKVISK